MITERAVKGAVRQPWMTQPEPVTFSVRVDDESNLMTLELPSGTKIALDFSVITEMARDIPNRK